MGVGAGAEREADHQKGAGTTPMRARFMGWILIMPKWRLRKARFSTAC